MPRIGQAVDAAEYRGHHGTVNLSGRVSRDLGGRKMSQGVTLPNATDFCPEAEALAPGRSVLGGSDMIATKMKQVVDLIVS